jgi:hypothetical protein
MRVVGDQIGHGADWISVGRAGMPSQGRMARGNEEGHRIKLMTIDMHALRPRTFAPDSNETVGAIAPHAAGEWDYPTFWHLDAPEVHEDEEVVGTLFGALDHMETAQMLLDAAAPEDGARLQEALWSSSRRDDETRWSGDQLLTVVGLLSRIPDATTLGQAIPRLDDEAVTRLSERLPLTRFYTPAPVTMEQKREALLLWIHNAGIIGSFFGTALEHGCDVAF